MRPNRGRGKTGKPELRKCAAPQPPGKWHKTRKGLSKSAGRDSAPEGAAADGGARRAGASRWEGRADGVARTGEPGQQGAVRWPKGGRAAGRAGEKPAAGRRQPEPTEICGEVEERGQRTDRVTTKLRAMGCHVPRGHGLHRRTSYRAERYNNIDTRRYNTSGLVPDCAKAKNRT